LGVRHHTFNEEYRLNLPNAIKSIVAQTLFNTGREIFLMDQNDLEDRLIFKMAISEEFLIPLKQFRERRLYANIDHDFVVPLGTAAFLTAKQVRNIRKKYKKQFGIVHSMKVPSNASLASSSNESPIARSNTVKMDDSYLRGDSQTGKEEDTMREKRIREEEMIMKDAAISSASLPASAAASETMTETFAVNSDGMASSTELQTARSSTKSFFNFNFFSSSKTSSAESSPYPSSRSHSVFSSTKSINHQADDFNPEEASSSSNVATKDAVEESERCELDVKDEEYIVDMIKSLNSCHWEKVFVHFRSFFPTAHNRICAMTKFGPAIDRMFGHWDGRQVMDHAFDWLSAESVTAEINVSQFLESAKFAESKEADDFVELMTVNEDRVVDDFVIDAASTLSDRQEENS
jgi:hypothetical protein